MSDNHLFSALASAAPSLDKKLALLADGSAVTYGEMLALSAQFAGLLVARGVKPGDRVAVQVEKSWPCLALYLATVRAGAVYLPLNTGYTLNEVRYFLGDAEPALFVCRPEIKAEARALAGELGVAGVETLDGEGAGSLMRRDAGWRGGRLADGRGGRLPVGFRRRAARAG